MPQPRRIIATAAILLAVAPTARAATSAATRPTTRPDVAKLHPTEQELRAPAWWLDRAMEQAAQIAEPKARGSAFWHVGVDAFDAGRLDLALQILAMGALSNQEQGTLGWRLANAYADAGDADRLATLAAMLPAKSLDRSSAYAELAAIRVARGDVPAARRIVDDKLTDESLGRIYLRLVERGEAGGNLEQMWSVAERMRLAGETDLLPFAYLPYIRAAGKAGKPDLVERGVKAFLDAQSVKDDPERLFALAGTLTIIGQVERGKAMELKAVQAKDPKAIGSKDAFLDVNDFVAAGLFPQARRRAELEPHVFQRAMALATLARGLADAKPGTRDAAAALKTAEQARTAMRQFIAAPPDPAPDPFSWMHAYAVAREIACAESAAGRPAAAIVTLRAIADDGDRQCAVAQALRDRSGVGDVAFVKAFIADAADIAFQTRGYPREASLQYDLTCALREAGDLPAAARVAAGIGDQSLREQALVIVAGEYVKRRDVVAFDAISDAIAKSMAAPPEYSAAAHSLAGMRGEMLETQAVWKDVCHPAADPPRRLQLMLGAARGLLSRLTPEERQ